MASVKFVPAKGGVKGILDYVTNREKTIERLITGVNCMAETALHEFNAVKNQFGKKEGRSYYHIVQSFSPDDELDFDTAHENMVCRNNKLFDDTLLKENMEHYLPKR